MNKQEIFIKEKQFGTWPAMLITLSVVGIISGILYALTVYFMEVDLFIIFPILMGFILAYVAKRFGAEMVGNGKILGLAAFSVCISIASYYVASTYFSLRSAIEETRELAQEETGEEFSIKEVEDALNEALIELVGEDGYYGMFLLNLRESALVGSSSDDGISIGYTGGIAVIVIQILIGVYVFRGSYLKNHDEENGEDLPTETEEPISADSKIILKEDSVSEKKE